MADVEALVEDVSQRLLQALNLQNAGKADEAGALFERILIDDANNFVALYSLALITLNRGEAERAIDLIDRAIAVNPNFASAHGLKGSALQGREQLDAALACYDRALLLNPEFCEVLVNRGVLLHALKRQREALLSFQRALEINPNSCSALANRGVLLGELNQHQAAAADFERLVGLEPEFDYGLGLLAHARMHYCDWRDEARLRAQIAAGLRQGKRVCKTLAWMSLSDDAALQLQCARIFAEHRFQATGPSAWTGPKYRHSRIRVAYVSPDFREHPVAHLSASVFEQHDHSRFETIGVSIGPDDGGPLASRLRQGFDRFIEARTRRSDDIVALLRQAEVDIAVDLAGYTADSRTELFVRRMAPLQVNWLGYPGTMGSACYDYMLADREVVPAEYRDCYAEQIVALPGSYLPVDDRRVLPEATPSRAECGLPEHGFVFCAFNHAHKISPEVFAIWLRLLARVEGSVLWLMKLHEATEANLRAAAAAQGIDPARLIFASRVPKVEDHLVRYRRADLFLDTFPYNAHSTAVDALYLGLPVLTCSGQAFASRVAGGVLNALGFAELVTDSLQGYEQRGLALATGPNELLGLRQRLLDPVRRNAVFNSQRFCRALEAAFTQMWSRWQDGQAPTHFAVADTPPAPPPPRRLQIGGAVALPGWQWNGRSGAAIEAGGVRELSAYPDASFDEVLVEQVLAQVSQAAMVATLRGLRRILAPRGRLLICVPDLARVAAALMRTDVDKEQRFALMRTLFGLQRTPAEFNLIGLDYEILADYLAAAGFERVERVDALLPDQTGTAIDRVPNALTLNLIVHRGMDDGEGPRRPAQHG